MPRLAKPPIKVPFGPPGIQQSFPVMWNLPGQNWQQRQDPIYKDNYEFDATLRIEGFHRGRSAANFTMVDNYRKNKYNMFMSDLVEALKGVGAEPGENGAILTGRWTFCKKGSNFGIKLVK